MINERRDRFESIFKKLRKADIKRKNLYLAWDFTVASDENIAARVLHMRDDAFAQLGDTDLADLDVARARTAVQRHQRAELHRRRGRPNMARRVQGTFTVPCYLTPRLRRPRRHLRSSTPTGSRPATATGPPTSSASSPAPRSPPAPGRRARRSTGMACSAAPARSTSSPSRHWQRPTTSVCATDRDRLLATSAVFAILQNLCNFPKLADRLQQGLLDELFLGRLMIHPHGLPQRPGLPRRRDHRLADRGHRPAPASTTTATARAASSAER